MSQGRSSVVRISESLVLIVRGWQGWIPCRGNQGSQLVQPRVQAEAAGESVMVGTRRWEMLRMATCSAAICSGSGSEDHLEG